jgi:hypothetical protein
VNVTDNTQQVTATAVVDSEDAAQQEADRKLKAKRARVAAERLEMLNAMNEKHAVVNLRGKTAVANLRDPEGVSYSSFASLREQYHHIRIPTGVSAEGVIGYGKLGSTWLSWKSRRQYDRVVFEPGQPPKAGALNLWRGFGVEPKAGDWSKYRALIEDVICDGNKEHSEYLLNWMARAVQEPDQVGRVAIVLRGDEGIGKGVFAQGFGSLYREENFRHITDVERLTQRFNTWLSQCSVLFADEAFWGGNKSARGVLYGLVTEPTIFTEPKGLNSFSVQNCLHLIMASNHDWVVPAGSGARRFFVMDVPSTRKDDKAYFAAILEELKNGGKEAMLADLLARDLKKFDVTKFPRTRALEEQQLLTLEPIPSWWHERLVDGWLPTGDGSHSWPVEVSKELLLKDCQQSVLGSGERYVPNATKLALKLRRLIPKLKDRRPTNGRRVWVMPSLEACRAFWDEQMRTKTDWDTVPRLSAVA